MQLREDRPQVLDRAQPARNPSAQARFGDDGVPNDAAAGVAAKAMLDQLGWWARSLAEARAARPYPG